MTQKLLPAILGVSLLGTLCMPATSGAQAPAAAARPIQYKKAGTSYVLVLRPGDKLVDSLKAFQEKEKLPSAHLVGLGFVKNSRIGFYSGEQKKYQEKAFPEPMELASLTGSLSWVDGKPWIHCHAVLSGADFHAIGGHLMEAEFALTGEVYITPLDLRIERRHDPALNVKVIDLK